MSSHHSFKGLSWLLFAIIGRSWSLERWRRRRLWWKGATPSKAKSSHSNEWWGQSLSHRVNFWSDFTAQCTMYMPGTKMDHSRNWFKTPFWDQPRWGWYFFYKKFFPLNEWQEERTLEWFEQEGRVTLWLSSKHSNTLCYAVWHSPKHCNTLQLLFVFDWIVLCYTVCCGRLCCVLQWGWPNTKRD